MTGGELSHVRLFFSASVPRPELDTPRGTRATALVLSLLGELLAGGGHVVFGGHPSMTPLVRYLRRRLPDATGAVELHQLRCFGRPTDWDPETCGALVQHGEAGTKVGSEAFHAELSAMRRAMVQRANAAVFVGGQLTQDSLSTRKAGLQEELDVFREAHPDGPVYLAGLLGGLTEDALIPAERGRQAGNGLSAAEQQTLWTTPSPDVVAGLVLAGLRRRPHAGDRAARAPIDR